MTVKDVIKLVCDFVGEKDIVAKMDKESPLSDAEQQKVDLMTRCFNLVVQEIACDYFPFLTKESIDVQNSVLNFSNLSKKVVHIYEIKNRFGMSLRFRLFPNHVEIYGNAKSVVYSFMPDELSLNSTLDLPCGLTERVIAYGVTSEYLLIDGLGDDAEIWENRYKESLFILSRKRGEHILPRRRWL